MIMPNLIERRCDVHDADKDKNDKTEDAMDVDGKEVPAEPLQPGAEVPEASDSCCLA